MSDSVITSIVYENQKYTIGDRIQIACDFSFSDNGKYGTLVLITQSSYDTKPHLYLYLPDTDRKEGEYNYKPSVIHGRKYTYKAWPEHIRVITLVKKQMVFNFKD